MANNVEATRDMLATLINSIETVDQYVSDDGQQVLDAVFDQYQQVEETFEAVAKELEAAQNQGGMTSQYRVLERELEESRDNCARLAHNSRDTESNMGAELARLKAIVERLGGEPAPVQGQSATDWCARAMRCRVCVEYGMTKFTRRAAECVGVELRPGGVYHERHDEFT